jgi:tRNA threonylcarbamoyladenosine biosynthesis protein TsaE
LAVVTLITAGEEQTQQLGGLIGQLVKEPLSIFLQGTLGAGKSVLARGVARGLGVAEEVPITSPTFTLMNHYSARFDLYHFDLYRICDPDELLEIGFDEYAYGAGVALVEWPERIGDQPEGLWLLLEPVDAEHRAIRLSAQGDVAAELLTRLLPQLGSCGTVAKLEMV